MNSTRVRVASFMQSLIPKSGSLFKYGAKEITRLDAPCCQSLALPPPFSALGETGRLLSQSINNPCLQYFTQDNRHF